MISPLLAVKAWRDTCSTPGRSAALLLAVAACAIALVTTLASRDALLRGIAESFESAVTPDVVLVADGVDEATLVAARKLPGIAAADMGRTLRARVEATPGTWIGAVVNVVPSRPRDVSTYQGDIPPPGFVALERSSATLDSAAASNQIRIRFPGSETATVAVSGAVHDTAVAPGWQDHVAYIYMTAQTAQDLGLAEGFDELRVRLNGSLPIETVTSQILQLADQRRLQVHRIEAPARAHPHADHMRAVLLLLSAFSALSLVAVCTLSVNLILTFMWRHRRHIGVLKATGASRSSICIAYAGFSAIPAAAGAVIGAAVGLLGAAAFSEFVAAQLNLVAEGTRLTWMPVVLASLAAFVAPVFASFVAAWFVSSISTVAALGRAGFESPVRTIRTRLRRSVWLALALRGLVRRRLRSALAASALALAGAALVTGPSVHKSLVAAVDTSLSKRLDTIDARLLFPVDADELAKRIASINGVEQFEIWGGLPVSIARTQDESQSRLGSSRYGALAPPSSSRFLVVHASQGRWFRSGNSEAVVPASLLAREPALALGAEVELIAKGGTARVQIVGIVEEVAEPSLWISPTVYDQLVGRPGTAGAVRVVTSAVNSKPALAAIEDAIFEAGSAPAFAMTVQALRQATVDHFAILLTLLILAAAGAIIIAALAVSSTLTATLVERRREIAVLRAVGASSRQIEKIFATEVMTLAFAGAVGGLLLSPPIIAAMGLLLGRHGIHATVPFEFSWGAAAAWVVLAILISAIAALAPVRSALRVRTSELLTVE